MWRSNIALKRPGTYGPVTFITMIPAILMDATRAKGIYLYRAHVLLIKS